MALRKNEIHNVNVIPIQKTERFLCKGLQTQEENLARKIILVIVSTLRYCSFKEFCSRVNS